MTIAPPSPGPPRPFAPPPFVTACLASGLTARAARWGKRPTVAVSVVFPGAGCASDPPGREGTAELTADLYLGGTRRCSAKELAAAIDDLSATLEVSAGADSSVARLGILEPDLDAGLALLAEVLTEATFPEDEFQKSRRRQIDTLKEQRSQPDFLAHERLLDRLYPGHPYGRLTPTERGLASTDRDDVVRFSAERLSLCQATLLLAGSVGPERLLAAAERAFGGLPIVPASPPPPIADAPPVRDVSVHLVHRPGSVQTNLLFARPAVARNHSRYLPALVANQSLGGGASSRLFHVLREERGLTYGAYSSLSPRVRAGHFGASIDCRTDVTRTALEGLLGLVRDFAAEGPTPAEHERSIRYLSGIFILGRETPGAIVQDEVSRLLNGLPDDEWATFRERLAAVTVEDAREAARDFFDPSIGVLAAVGDEAKLRPVLEAFGEVTLWDADGPRA
ncbi:MAG: M16 family metallopeptidase [Acidithiobacillales bacterium]